VVVGCLAFAGCGGEGASSLFDAVPASAWPTIAGVSVLDSEGYAGQECCEQHMGGRRVTVRVDADDDAAGSPMRWLQRAMLDAGWSPERCANARMWPGEELCARRPGLFVVLRPPPSKVRETRGVVLVDITHSPSA
jgi:hypothetical protein